MFYAYCWHRPGRIHRSTWTCRHCGIAIEECGCVSYSRSPDGKCGACEGSGWAGIVRSKFSAMTQTIGIGRIALPICGTPKDDNAPAEACQIRQVDVKS